MEDRKVLPLFGHFMGMKSYLEKSNKIYDLPTCRCIPEIQASVMRDAKYYNTQWSHNGAVEQAEEPSVCSSSTGKRRVRVSTLVLSLLSGMHVYDAISFKTNLDLIKKQCIHLLMSALGRYA